jgi:uncharacterized protein (TIGR02246 family)
MLSEIPYEDGLVLSGKADDDIVADVEAHIREGHPGLAELITRDQILVTVREARFALRANGAGTSPLLIGPCPFDRWAVARGRLEMGLHVQREAVNRRWEMTAHTPEELDSLWAQAFNDGNADGVLSLYEPGAAFVLPTGEAVLGVEAIRETLDGYLAMKPRIDLRTKKVLRADDVALVYSSWTLSATAEDGSALDMAGDATVVSRQHPDGTWRIAIDDPGWITT